MLDTLKILLEHSPLLALFAAIGIGYAVGQISIGYYTTGAVAAKVAKKYIVR